MRERSLVFIASAGAVACLAGLLLWQSRSSRPGTAAPGEPLVLFCAAGIRAPVERAARDYEQAYGVRIQPHFAGSGTLLSSLRVAEAGDLFLAADASYMESARALGLLAETIPLARQRPVIAVAKGNPKGVRGVDDLQRADLRVAMANPDAASVGRTARALLQQAGKWDAIERRVTVFKPTVNDVANDVRIGSVDAGILWDATARQHADLQLVVTPEFDGGTETISIGVLLRSRQPEAALRFARYLGARDRGLDAFTRFHYEPVDGDEWAEHPEIVLFSGAMLRPGIEETLKEFERREGCRITTVYNGCGILVAQMRAGQRPDAYFSCDTSFMTSVADLYLDPVDVVDNHLMIIVEKGNPKGIRTVEDLTRPGVRLGLPHHEKSAMGNIAWKMLSEMSLYDALAPNLQVESPTGDFLVNQIRTGSLDAIIACRSNWVGVSEHLDAVAIAHPLARMTQPYAVGRGTRYGQMMLRLRQALVSAESRARFEAEGFGWRYGAGPAS